MTSHTPHPNLIAQRVSLCRSGEYPLSVARLASGWVVLNDRQPEALPGCCVLLPDFEDPGLALNRHGVHPSEGLLNDLVPEARAMFLVELARIGDALLTATGCEQVNYLVLCNAVPALHGHVMPRYAGEEPAKRRLDPFAAYDFPGGREPDPEGTPADRELVRKLRGVLAR